MENIELNSFYKHKNGNVYKPLFLDFENNKDLIVYIDNNNNIWAKNKIRFSNGMKKTIVDNFCYSLKSIKDIISDKINYNENENIEIICIANDSAEDKTDYPLMVIFKLNDNLKIYKFNDFVEKYIS